MHRLAPPNCAAMAQCNGALQRLRPCRLNEGTSIRMMIRFRHSLGCPYACRTIPPSHTHNQSLSSENQNDTLMTAPDSPNRRKKNSKHKMLPPLHHHHGDHRKAPKANTPSAPHTRSTKACKCTLQMHTIRGLCDKSTSTDAEKSAEAEGRKCTFCKAHRRLATLY